MLIKKLLIVLLMPIAIKNYAQNGYRLGQTVDNITATKILNNKSAAATLNELQGNITIIDFFGTWCVPCIKALPELIEYKNRFKDDLHIILVSSEKADKLNQFISARQPFAFPLIVDEENTFTNLFQPPSYPYTIVLDKNLKILSITNAADLTDIILEKFISENDSIIKINSTTSDSKNIIPQKLTKRPFSESNNRLVKLSQEFVYAAKTNEDASGYIEELNNLPYDELLTGLKTDNDKKAFWINLYNAFTNYSLHKNPGQYKSRNKFFKNKNIIVAGKKFSLDNIEHGILRRSKIKWSLGYLNKLFPGKIEKDLRVNQLDYRIHFALNCGAKSCPPIAFYNPENLDIQLEVAANAYLSGEVSYHRESNILELPALISWFRRDFGGKKNVVSILKQKNIISDTVHPKIRFKKYDWSLYLNNYK